MNTHDPIPPEYRGWWRITETSQWSSKFLDSLGPALLSLDCGVVARALDRLARVHRAPHPAGVVFADVGFSVQGHDDIAASGRDSRPTWLMGVKSALRA